MAEKKKKTGEKKTKTAVKKTAAKKTVTSAKKSVAKVRVKTKPKSPKKAAPAKVVAKKTLREKKAVASSKSKKAAQAKVAPKKTLPKKATVVAKKSKKGVKPAAPRSKKPVKKETEEDRRIALRRYLVARREEIVKEAKSEISKYIKGETRQLVDTALDDGDWSVVDLSEDISLRQLGTHKGNLQKIDEALRKLDEGTYGICEDCGEPISEKRLKIMPFAIYCTDCQENREELEELER